MDAAEIWGTEEDIADMRIGGAVMGDMADMMEQNALMYEAQMAEENSRFGETPAQAHRDYVSTPRLFHAPGG